MIKLTRNLGPTGGAFADRLRLDCESRSRARLRVRLESGAEAGLFLEYGKTLAQGDILAADDGFLVRVECEPEAVITAHAKDWGLLARGCYHLGNRHVPLQIGELWLRFTPDPVLEKLVRQLGFVAVPETAPFTPETGAYASGHGHDGGGRHG
ncbi:MAG: urease accessory protein UreE [Desulfovibrio sp.]|nr:urease accessory protein UreE [Desulfovibrio sp.]